MTHHTYDNIGLETEVLEASPHRLIQMMYEKLVNLIHLSRQQIQANEIQKKSQTLSKAIDIVNYLRMTLNRDNPEAAGLSEKLEEVYSFIEHQLIQANMKNDPACLELALQKLLIIKSAWDSIADAK